MNKSKKDQLSFYKSMRQYFIKLGFIPISSSERYELKINTKIGFYYVNIHSDKSFCFTVTSNFLDQPEAAKNYFSHWKQNIHTSSPLKEAIEEAQNFFNNILNEVKL